MTVNETCDELRAAHMRLLDENLSLHNTIARALIVGKVLAEHGDHLAARLILRAIDDDDDLGVSDDEEAVVPAPAAIEGDAAGATESDDLRDVTRFGGVV